jgi:uncharacterized protein YndB with AHSA1/START domain
MAANIQQITIEATIEASIEKVWNTWTNAEDIKEWNNANDDWHTPNAEIDLRPGGKFVYRMEAKDGSFGFDFEGRFNDIVINKLISYTIADGRKVRIAFSAIGNTTKVEETFEAETINSLDLQRQGWQAILNNFKTYVEGKNKNSSN